MKEYEEINATIKYLTAALSEPECPITALMAFKIIVQRS